MIVREKKIAADLGLANGKSVVIKAALADIISNYVAAEN